mgnify:FL=1
MPDSALGYNLAQEGTDLNKTGSGGGEKPKKAQSLRYPLKRIENKSDYMEIQVIEYEPPNFNLGNNKTDTTNIELATIGTGTESNRKKKAKKYIYLPIPQNLSDTNSITWGDDRLNPLEAFGLSAATGLTQGVREAKGEVARFFNSPAVTSAGSILGKNKDVINATVGAALYNTLGGSVSLQSVITRATGQILNPNLELLFQGVNIRSFSFVFDFAPRDQREAREVKKIIRAFKESAAAKDESIEKLGKVFIKSPDVFIVKFKTGGKDHPFLNRFKPMALVDMSLNYTASGTYATYQDGTPVHIQMSLTFKELNPIYASDYTEDKEGKLGVGY